MLRVWLATAAVALMLGGFGASPQASARDASATQLTEAFAQALPRERRARTRIRVTPRCPYYAQASEYPRPSDCDFPGPGFVRQCEGRLVQENRPSGTVVVPRMWCWWQRG